LRGDRFSRPIVVASNRNCAEISFESPQRFVAQRFSSASGCRPDQRRRRRSKFRVLQFLLRSQRFIPLLSKDLVNVLVTALSVFAALLFNLLLLIFDIIRKSKNEPDTQDIKLGLLKEIYANISYSIFVSIVSIMVLLVPLLNIDIPRIASISMHVDKVVSFIIYFLIGNFVLTLLMILKRVHVLLTEEFKLTDESK
jgi:hypothetical protein